MAEIDPYRVLGIDPKPNLTDAEIKKAYRKLALKLHPDKRKDSERERAQQEFDQLQKAYDILLDPEARAALENLAKARQATRKRHESQDAKRRKMREDLERRERAAERGKNEEEEAKERLQQELARLRKSFATRRKGYDAEAATDNAAETNAAHDDKTNGAATRSPGTHVPHPQGRLAQGHLGLRRVQVTDRLRIIRHGGGRRDPRREETKRQRPRGLRDGSTSGASR